MGSRGSNLPDNVHYKRETVSSNITSGEQVFDYLVNNDIIPDCSVAFVSLHWDFNGDTMPGARHFVYIGIAGLENKSAQVRTGCRYNNGFQAVNIGPTYDMILTAGDVLDVYYITSEE